MSVNVLSGMSGGDPFKDEIVQLRALLAEGGLNGNILEGRYLNQLKRVRQLGVQLEREKTYSKELIVKLAAMEERVKEQQQQWPGSKFVEVSKVRARGIESSDTKNENEEHQNTTTSLRERLERAYVQLNESKLQLEEQKKETLRMRKVLQHEIGGTPQELDALLKNVAEGSGGWRGRAQQIVVLKSKVKELERVAAAAVTRATHDEESGADVSGDSGRKHVDAVSAVTATVATVSNRDMDDVARERVVELQNRRLLNQRELQEALNRKTAELEALKRRVDAAQARHVNLEADNHTLREYLQTVIDKTENDNALIDAYKEELGELRQELRTARMKLREWEVWEKGDSKGDAKRTLQSREKRGNSLSRCVSANPLNTGTAIALAGADAAIEINRLKIQNEELRAQLARSAPFSSSFSHLSDADDNSEHGDGHRNDVTSAAHKPRGVDDDTALVIHWLRSVAPSHETASTVGSAWQTRVAEVLRKAHGIVCFLEKQRNEDGERLSKCYETIQHLQERQKKPHVKKEGNNKNDGGSNDKENSLMLVSAILQENCTLKQRVKLLQDMMEKERLAYESLHHVSSSGGFFAKEIVNEKNVVDIAEYENLRHQYEELRTAFNILQKERLKHSED